MASKTSKKTKNALPFSGAKSSVDGKILVSVTRAMSLVKQYFFFQEAYCVPRYIPGSLGPG